MSIVRSVSTLIAVPALASAALAQLPDAAAPTPLPMASPFPATSAPLTLATPVTAPLPPAPNPIGISPFPPAPGGPTLGSFLGLSYAQRQYRQMQMARTPLGQLRSRIQTPLSKLTGGLIPPFPPQVPSLAQLQAPGPIGAAAKVKLDRQGAKDRIEAVQYLGKVDCHYWPEAEGALVGALRADRNEWVRLAAAETLGKGCCCTKKTVTALSIAATCSDADGNPSEKSPRVVAAAQAALSRCLASACAGPAAVEAPAPAAPPVERPRETPRERASDANQAAWSKPAPAGQEKSAGGLSPQQVARPTGDAFYERVKQQPWRDVLAFARHAEAHSPVALAALPPITPNLEPDTPGIEVADARTHSERPANLLDMLLHNDEEARVTLPVAASVAQFTPAPTPAPAQTATLPAPVARQALPAPQMNSRPARPQPQVASRPPQPQPAAPMRPPATEARQPAMPTPIHTDQSRLLAATPTTETGTPPPSRPAPRPAEAVVTATEPVKMPKTFPDAVKPAKTPKMFPANAETATAAPKMFPADAKPRKSPAPAATLSTSAARVLTLLAHPTNPKQVAQEIDQLAAWDVTAHPNTVRALMRTATGSGDELIRAACVRAVVRGQVKDAGTLASLERMKNDESVKVQVEATAGLMELRRAAK